jgi:hypothetical protein
VATVVTSEQIAMLPVQDRTALSLSLLLPGTAVDVTRPKRNATNDRRRRHHERHHLPC